MKDDSIKTRVKPVAIVLETMMFIALFSWLWAGSEIGEAVYTSVLMLLAGLMLLCLFSVYMMPGIYKLAIPIKEVKPPQVRVFTFVLFLVQFIALIYTEHYSVAIVLCVLQLATAFYGRKIYSVMTA